MHFSLENPREHRNHGLKHNPFKTLVAPRPIGWIGTLSKAGVMNLAPYSYFNAVNDAPPMVMFSSVGSQDSLINIEETGEFMQKNATSGDHAIHGGSPQPHTSALLMQESRPKWRRGECHVVSISGKERRHNALWECLRTHEVLGLGVRGALRRATFARGGITKTGNAHARRVLA